MTRAATGRRRAAAGLALVLAAMAPAPFAGADAPAPPRRHVVEIRGLTFEPSLLRVSPGDTVVWRNADLVPHTVTAGDGRWDSGPLAAGETWLRVVGDEAPARQPYFCRFHPVMQGALEGPPAQPR